jgi:hypothetical protein
VAHYGKDLSIKSYVFQYELLSAGEERRNKINTWLLFLSFKINGNKKSERARYYLFDSLLNTTLLKNENTTKINKCFINQKIFFLLQHKQKHNQTSHPVQLNMIIINLVVFFFYAGIKYYVIFSNNSMCVVVINTYNKNSRAKEQKNKNYNWF